MKELADEDRTPALCSGSLKDRRPTAQRALRERVRGWLVARIRTRSDRLFRDLDKQARQQGWNMETGPYGLSRSYRDPRFDALRAQRDLSGDGVDETPESGAGPSQAAGKRQT